VVFLSLLTKSPVSSTRRVQISGPLRPLTSFYQSSVKLPRSPSVFIWPTVSSSRRLLFRANVVPELRAPFLSWVRQSAPFSLDPAYQQPNSVRHGPPDLFSFERLTALHALRYRYPRSALSLKYRERLLFLRRSFVSNPALNLETDQERLQQPSSDPFPLQPFYGEVASSTKKFASHLALFITRNNKGSVTSSSSQKPTVT
jgi:hypothetical protein